MPEDTGEQERKRDDGVLLSEIIFLGTGSSPGTPCLPCCPFLAKNATRMLFQDRKHIVVVDNCRSIGKNPLVALAGPILGSMYIIPWLIHRSPRPSVGQTIVSI
jgi:hypothetical protein